MRKDGERLCEGDRYEQNTENNSPDRQFSADLA